MQKTKNTILKIKLLVSLLGQLRSDCCEKFETNIFFWLFNNFHKVFWPQLFSADLAELVDISTKTVF